MEIKFIVYTSLTCPHCVEFMGIFEKLQSDLKKKFKNITFEEYIRENNGTDIFDSIPYTPYIKIIINGNTFIFEGNRTFNDFVKFIKDKINNIKGGDPFYYKYIKMKDKYLKLKRKCNIE